MNFLKTIVGPALRLMGEKYRKRSLSLIPLLLLQSILDVLSVASIAPMALLIIRPESLERNALLSNWYHAFSFGSQRSYVLAWVSVIVLFFLAKHLFSRFVTRLKAQTVFDIASTLSQKTINHFVQLSYSEYHDHQSSLNLVRIAHLPISFANNILLAFSVLITEGLILLLLLVSLLWYDWRSVAVVMIIVLPAVVFYRMIRKTLNAINDSLKNNYPNLIHQVLQLFENFVEINLYQKQEYFSRKIQTLNRDLHETHVSQTILQANSFRLFETTAAFGLCLLVVYSTLAQVPPDATAVLLGLYTAAGFRAIPSLNRIFIAFLQLRANEHVLTDLTIFQSVKNKSSSSDEKLAFRDRLELKNISFGYPEKKPLINQLSLIIRKGEKIALTGSSASGKTTLLLIIMGFLKVNQGEIWIDSKLLYGQLPISLAYVPQHPLILDGSLIENVAFGIDPLGADAEKIEKLLYLLGLGSWLSGLPAGLLTRCGEKGIKLSGGQRQRLAIARALYRESEILVLDEPTSQVDSVTEAEVHAALKTLETKTVIMVTHRQSSLPLFDRVLHLENGVLRESKA